MQQPQNIKLRAIEPSDVEFLYQMENNAGEWDYSGNIQPFSHHTLLRYIDNEANDIYANRQLRLVIEDTASHHPLGMIDLYDYEPRHARAWVGIMIKPENRKKGIGLLALKQLADYCRHMLHLRMLLSEISENNTASQSLFTRGGYTHIATLPRYFQFTPEAAESAFIFQLCLS